MFAFDSQLFWYKLVFMAELLLIEYLFSYKLKKKSFFGLRIIAHIAICFAVAFLYPLFSYNAAYTSAMFMILFATTMLTMKIVYDETWKSLMFAALASYTTQHLAYEIYISFVVVFGLDNNTAMGAYGEESTGMNYSPWTALIYAAAYSLTYWLMFVLFGDKITAKNSDMRISNLKFMTLSAFILFTNIVLNAVITYRSGVNYDFVYLIVIHLSNILCCMFSIIMQFGLFTRGKLEYELVAIKKLWEKDKKQYKITKETIDIINLKCHDLRHQIREIGNGRVIGKDVIDEIENTVNIYDSMIKTGNEALDVVLTEKSLFCQKNHIICSCIVDGKGFDFMKPADIYSLFGNALENAIESVIKIDDSNKRIINISIKRSGKFLSAHIDNCTENKITMVNGLPVTDKQERCFHGFGTKSIKAIVDKYNGDLSFSVENGVFNMNIMFISP